MDLYPRIEDRKMLYSMEWVKLFFLRQSNVSEFYRSAKKVSLYTCWLILLWKKAAFISSWGERSRLCIKAKKRGVNEKLTICIRHEVFSERNTAVRLILPCCHLGTFLRAALATSYDFKKPWILICTIAEKIEIVLKEEFNQWYF